MPTTNLGLPLVTGNMTSNVPRDMNALAEEIDLKVASKKQIVDVSSGLATHLAEIVTVPEANKIPRANANGKLDFNWMDFANNKAASGYTKLPNGLILQWREIAANTLTSATGGNMTVSFPIVFPNAVCSVWATMEPSDFSDTEKILGATVGALNHMAVYYNKQNTLFPRKLYCLAIGW